ncbi:MAG: sialidase family protein [Armatimonadota bacterium]
MITQSAWRDAAEVQLNGLKVTLSAPVRVHRTRAYCWFPSMFRYGDGKLAAMISGYGDFHVSSSAVLVSRSKDGGLTWTEPVVGVDGGFDGVVQPNGDLVLLPYYLRPCQEGMHSPYNLIKADSGMLEYVPSGVTVTGWPRPDRSFAPDLGTSGFVFNGQPVTLQDGSHLMTLYGYFEGADRLGLICAESRDAVHWKIRAIIADESCPFEGGDGPSEAALVRQADGRILCVFRLGSYVPYAQCWSSDEGQTWTKPVQMDGPFSVQPSLARLGDMLALSGGRPGLFLWLNPAGDALDWQAVDIMAHHNVCVPAEQITPDTTSAYTETVALDDRTLLYMYDRIPNGWAPIPDEMNDANCVWVLRAQVG